MKLLTRNSKGATAIEYAIVAGLVGAAAYVVAADKASGQGVKITFCKTASYISGGDGTDCSGSQQSGDGPLPGELWGPDYTGPQTGVHGFEGAVGYPDGSQCAYKFNYRTGKWDPQALDTIGRTADQCKADQPFSPPPADYGG